MAPERVERRLAAILAADAVGYSRLVGADEEGTLARLRAVRDELIDPSIARHGGRIVKTTGDGLLVEFPSVVAAVRNAVEVQRAMAERNGELPEAERLEFRVGINQGDIVVEGDDILGDGVNVAARLEALAQPGGICLSERVFSDVRGKLDVGFEDLGLQNLKNIAEHVRVYRVRFDRSGVESAASAPAVSTPLPLPDKPSIAVLPFENMSADPEQEYFSDGISEDIITALSRVRQFFVIARNTTFTYKGQSVDVTSVAKDLAVRYVLEGSVRKSGNRVRITAQLVDGITGSHIWANRYDRELKDTFAVQDEITQTVVGTLGPELDRAEQRRALRKPPHNLDAWENYHRGMHYLYKRTKEGNVEARRFFDLAIEQDPNFATPHAGRSRSHTIDWMLGYSKQNPSRALEDALRAVELDDHDAVSHYALGLAYVLVCRDGDSALSAFKDAASINPNDAMTANGIAMALINLGRAEDAIEYGEQAIRISPSDPNIGVFFGRLAAANLFLGRHEIAVDWGRKAKQKTVSWIEHVALTAALAHLGRNAEARLEREGLEALRPGLSIEIVRDVAPTTDVSQLEILLDGLRKAGLPET